MDDTSLALRDVFYVLQRRWRLILVATLAVGAGAAVVAYGFLRNQYTAVAHVEVVKSRSGIRTNRDDITALPLDTFTYYVREASAAREVMQRHGLDRRPSSLSLDQFLERVRVRQIRNTGLIEVAVTLPSATHSRDIALDLARGAIALNNELMEKEKSQSVLMQEKEYLRVAREFEDVRNRWRRESMVADVRGLQEELHALGQLLRDVGNERAISAARWRDRAARVDAVLPYLEGPEAVPEIFSTTRSISEYQDLQDLFEGVLEHVAPGARPFDLLPVHVVTEQRNRVHDELTILLNTWRAERDGYKAAIDILDVSAEEIRGMLHDVEVRLASGEVVVKSLEKEFEVVSNQLGLQGQFLTEAAARVISERQELRLLGYPQVPERKSAPRRSLIVLSAMLVAAGAGTFLFLVIDMAALAAEAQHGPPA